ncbi:MULTISPECIES: hypothetical protein [unclassified Crossiella]|uniref:hypothetical protein n=1 Tax=unclassified Crossiella TaxID=2620835 RepID=UPI001FFFDF24|nr:MULTISPECIES: hypothetical protein [unclassified Crossiella]MCK2240697.1 hypothetical protein [Crossiella sp. S99.2]MCK2252852.1 hypothetical protein [Crossiella sp. S99.1]
MDNQLYPPMSPGSIAAVLIGTMIGLVLLAAAAVLLWRAVHTDRAARRTREQIDMQAARDAYERGLATGRMERERPHDDHPFPVGRVVDAINQLGRHLSDQQHRLTRQLDEMQTQLSRALVLAAGATVRTPTPPRPAPAPPPQGPAGSPTARLAIRPDRSMVPMP